MPARVTLYGLAAAAGAAGEGRLAARLAAAAEPEVRGGNLFIDPFLWSLIEQRLAAARAETNPGEWDKAWAAGAALTIEQAAAEVLGT